jgi:hypothetical protein
MHDDAENDPLAKLKTLNALYKQYCDEVAATSGIDIPPEQTRNPPYLASLIAYQKEYAAVLSSSGSSNVVCVQDKYVLVPQEEKKHNTLLSMSDATFRRHLDRYLAVKGIKPQTADELREERYKALMVVHRWSYWRYIHDPEVQVVNLTLQLQECDIWHGATKIG